MRKLLVGLLFVAFLLGSCAKKKCEYKDDGMVAPVVEQQAVKHYLDSLGITASLHPRGFYYKIDSAGYGNTEGGCSQITVAYKGWLITGYVFDQQNNFITQLSNVIDGWQQGVPLIRKGGKIHLYIPPSLGYGDQAQKNPGTGAVVIPPFSILIFDIDLLDVQ